MTSIYFRKISEDIDVASPTRSPMMALMIADRSGGGEVSQHLFLNGGLVFEHSVLTLESRDSEFCPRKTKCLTGSSIL